MATGSKLGLVMALLAGAAVAAAQPAVKHEESLEEARRAYEASDYGKAIEVLEEASAREPKNGDSQLLLELGGSMPGPVGGGEEKGRPHIQKLMELDAAEG